MGCRERREKRVSGEHGYDEGHGAGGIGREGAEEGKDGG